MDGHDEGIREARRHLTTQPDRYPTIGSLAGAADTITRLMRDSARPSLSDDGCYFPAVPGSPLMDSW
jgi:hypothetical protein